MNAKVTRVMAMAKNQQCPGIEGEDMACAILEFSNGALATLDMAWNTAGEQLSIHGTRGTAEYIGNQTLLLDSAVGEFHGASCHFSMPKPIARRCCAGNCRNPTNLNCNRAAAG